MEELHVVFVRYNATDAFSKFMRWVAAWRSRRHSVLDCRHLDETPVHCELVFTVQCEGGPRCEWMKLATDTTLRAKGGYDPETKQGVRCRRGTIHHVSIATIMRHGYSCRVMIDRLYETNAGYRIILDEEEKQRVYTFIHEAVQYSHRSSNERCNVSDSYWHPEVRDRLGDEFDTADKESRCCSYGLPPPSKTGMLSRIWYMTQTCVTSPCTPTVATYNLGGYFCNSCGSCDECRFYTRTDEIYRYDEKGTKVWLPYSHRPQICSELVATALVFAGWEPDEHPGLMTPVYIRDAIELQELKTEPARPTTEDTRIYLDGDA